MSFLDRFKPQPRWKHADATVRLAAVPELMTDDPEQRRALVELAGTDEDLRVRRAALARVDGVEDLVQLTAAEKDEDLRRGLTERLVAIASAGADTDGDAARALDGLDDPKQLGAVAKSSPHDTVRTAALAKVHDARTLSSIARHALDPQVALDAVSRVADPAELLNVALKTDHKEAGLAALDRLVAGSSGAEVRSTLDILAARARNKSVAKRARTTIQGIEETAAAERSALEQFRQRSASVLSRATALAAAPVGGDTRVQLADTEAAWLELGGSGRFAVEPDASAQFDTAIAGARSAIERYDLAIAEQQAAAERQASLRAARQELCERVEAIRGEQALEALEQARGEWEGLAAGADGLDQAAGDSALLTRFEAACRGAEDRHANRQAIEQAHVRLDALSHEAERVATGEPLDEAAWKQVTGEWAGLAAQAGPLDPGVAQRFADAEARAAVHVAEREAAAERLVRQHVQRIEQLIERAQARTAAEDLTIREADRISRDLRAALESPAAPDAAGATIPEPERHGLVERLKAALAAVTPRLQDLREMDEWKRFANAAVQEELIARTEALRTKYHFEGEGDGPSPDDIEKAARDLHDIQERWKQVAEAPRAQAQALWHRYRQAADPIQARAREFFATRSEERKTNLDRKIALIERAEALAESTDWIKTADELKKLQQEWQQVGAVPRNDTRATWKRFREACDKFFTRRNADLAERKETWSANLTRKEALCARAEELATSRDWDRAAAEIRRLQSEWKAVGPVRRNKSDAIWQRFRAACDTFFDRFKRRDEVDLEAKQADREALLGELEALALPAAADAPQATPAGLLESVRSLRTRWNQTSSVVRQGADPLSERFVDALERVMVTHPDQFRGTELDVDASRQKMEKLVEKVEGFLTEAPPAPSNASQALADMLREALASNTIGGRGSDEARWRAMGDEVRQAQAAWSRLGPVPGQSGRELTERFHRACNRFFDIYRRRVPPQQQGGGSGSGGSSSGGSGRGGGGTGSGGAGRRKELQTR